MAERSIAGITEETKKILLEDKDFLKGVVELFCNELMQKEMEEILGAKKHERNQQRTGYRCGVRERTLYTRVGTLTLLVPQDREGRFSTELFARYQRTEKALLSAMATSYIQGVSTRKVGHIMQELMGHDFSASTVSNMTVQLDKELERFRNRPLGSNYYPYMQIDARYNNVRVNGQIVSMGILSMIGINEQGKREVVACNTDKGESKTSWKEAFSNLKQRGMKAPLLCTSDAHGGLVSALKEEFPSTHWQRCQVHYKKNAMDKVTASKKQECKALLNEVFEASTVEDAKRKKHELVEWAYQHRHAFGEWVDESIDDTLACLHYPKEHRKRICSTNGLERINQELKRRATVIRIFPNEESLLRMAGAILIQLHETWSTSKQYLNMELLKGEQKMPKPVDMTLCG